MGIEKYKKQKIPDRSDQQKEVNRAKCATLYRNCRDREWILDDESYFTKTHSTINGNDNFYFYKNYSFYKKITSFGQIRQAFLREFDSPYR